MTQTPPALSLRGELRGCSRLHCRVVLKNGRLKIVAPNGQSRPVHLWLRSRSTPRGSWHQFCSVPPTPHWGPLCVRRAHGVPGVWTGPAFGSGSTLLPAGVLLGGRSSTCLGRRGAARAALGAPVRVLRCPTRVRCYHDKRRLSRSERECD